MNLTFKNEILRKGLSLFTVVMMTFGIMPTNVLTAAAVEAEVTDYVVGDTAEVKGDNTTLPEGTIPTGSHWAGPSAGVLHCTTDLHTHDADCYYKTCDHKDGHISTCYSSSTAYEVCPDKDNHQHNNTANITDVFTISGTNVTWVTTHPAYPAVYAIYKAAYDEAYASAKYFKDTVAKAAGVAAIATVTVCYTTTPGSEPDLCTHTCSELGGECYLKTCLKSEHLAHVEPDCYTYTWTVEWNVLNVNVSVSGKDGVTYSELSSSTVQYGGSVSFKLPAVDDIGWVATVKDGAIVKNSFSLSTTEATTITVDKVTNGNITVELSQQPIYNVTLNNATPEYGTASVSVDRGLDGTIVTVATTPKIGNANTRYQLASILVNGNAIEGNTFTINGEDVEVKVVFSVETLVGGSAADVLFDPFKTAAEQLDTLKANIFNAIVDSGASIPEDITVNDVEIYYYQYHDALIGQDGFNAGMKLLGEVADADDNSLITHTYYDFGERFVNGGDANERVRITGKDGTSWAGLYIEADLTLIDSRADAEIRVNSGVTVTYGQYTEAELLALLVDGLYDMDGNRLGGAELLSFTSDVEGLSASETAHIVEIKFAGNETHKATVVNATVTVNKAPVSIDVDNQIVKWGEEYNELPVITDPAGVSNIQFVVGIDISNTNYDGEIKGIVGHVQLLLPENLQRTLIKIESLISSALGYDVSFADGTTMKLSDLKKIVEVIDSVSSGSDYDEYFRVLFNMIDSISTNNDDIEIIVGGALPTNVGIYLIGAVTADSNYETAANVGVLAIYPDGIKAEIDWNQNDDNSVITNSLLASGAFDTEAHAVTVGQGGNLADATAQIIELFVGIDIDGNVTVESDPAKLNVGAYVEIAMVVNFGNQMYYSDPIVRPIVVAAETVDVDFVDHKGNVNNDRRFVYDGTAKDAMEGNLLVTYKYDGDGYKAGDNVLVPYSVRYFYVGVQNNGQLYASEEAPVNAGAYTIHAIIVIRDNDGNVSHIGQGAGALVIEPKETEFDMLDKIISDGAKADIDSMVTGNSNLPYAIYIIKNIAEGEVNVILPADWNITLPVGSGVDALVAILEEISVDGQYADVVETLVSVLNSIDMQTLTVNGEEPMTAGVYNITAIGFGNSNYSVSKANAVLTIKHQLVKTDANAPTCTEVGNNEYWTCSSCGKFFSDAEGVNEIEKDSWIIDALGHTEVVDDAVDPTCTETGLTEGKHCGVCGETLVEQTVVDALGHIDEIKDHACDRCGEKVSDHHVVDGIHYCDYCGKVVYPVVDKDMNHECDVCGYVMGTHKDEDHDHNCDYGCDEPVGECADADKDHYCDYGCGKLFGECIDSDKDHDCDYGCDKTFGSHSDADKNHVCEYCNVEIGKCADSDNNGKCDVCGINYGACVDADKDHKCDKHGEELSTHTISEGKHECDYCGTVLSECADFDNNGKCDVCGAELGSNIGAIVAAIAGVVVALGAAFGAYWFFIKKAPTAPTAPEAATTEEIPEDETSGEEASEEEISEEDASEESDASSEE